MKEKNNEKILYENLIPHKEISTEGGPDRNDNPTDPKIQKISIMKWFENNKPQMKTEQQSANELENYKRRVKRRKDARRRKLMLTVGGILLIGILIKIYSVYHSYSGYKVISMNEMVDAGVSRFKELDGNILHYSADGISLTSTADKLIWTDSYQMSQPVVESFGDVAAVYDLKGTQIAVYDKKGKLGSFQTDHPIIKASVSAKGEVAAILENGETTLINYYTETGSLIASSSTNMKNPGYPVDLAVSKDGLSVVVTYFVADEDTISSYLAFYNFGKEGKKKEDNLLGGVRFSGELIPEVQYLNNGNVVAYRENGFSLYKGNSEAKEIENIVFEENIVSSFGNGKYIGFVFRNNNSENMFLMRIYNSSGKLKMEAEFDLIYDDIKISDNSIIINNTTQIAVFNLEGIEKFNGNIEEGNIHEIVKVGGNRYTIAYSEGVITIKLK